MSQPTHPHSRLEAGLIARNPYRVMPPGVARPTAWTGLNSAVVEPSGRVEVWANEGGSSGQVLANGLRVLVVEDDALIGILLAETLEEMGYEVCAIEATEADAVAAAARYKPDLMIVDAWLGDGTGISAVDKVLRTGFIPHLFVSGDLARIKPLRPDAVMLQKPFNETSLASAIQRALVVRS